MQVTVTPSPETLGGDAVIVRVYSDEADVTANDDVNRLAGEGLSTAHARGELRGSKYDLTLFHGQSGKPGILYVGAGKDSELNGFELARLISAASRYLTGRGYREIGIADVTAVPASTFGHAAALGIVRGLYQFDLKRSKRSGERTVSRLTLLSQRDAGELEAGASIGVLVGEAGAIARDLVNLPANDLTPSVLAERAQALAASEAGLEAEILDEAAMAKLGMGALLGVSSGSAEPARLIIMRYGDANAATKLALVGKGLTFDSGGLSLKTADGMETMKCDMGGGAAVIAGMVAVARLAPANISVTGYVGATENMPSGTAMRPGDVLTALNGETIEVLNTDAEGRLVLADVLAHASAQGATHIVDFATLTGGAMVALGTAATLAVGKPMEWVRQVVQSAENGLERAWPMPLFEEYRRAMDSDVADIKNTGGRYGSALTAAAFLSDFVDGPQWTHMDIAGTAYADKATAYAPSGGTGEGVGTIVGIVQTLTANTQ